MKAFSLTVLIGMTSLMACSPFGNPPTSLPTPTASPSGNVNPSTEPTIYPTWTPSPDMSIPMVTPTVGAENINTKTEADIIERRELWSLDHAILNGDQSKILYTYNKTMEIDFNGWYSNPAKKTYTSGLWAFDRSTGEHKEVIAGNGRWGNRRFERARWLNQKELVYTDEISTSLIAKDFATGKTRVLFEATIIDKFEVYQNHLFVMYLKNGKKFLSRIELQTQKQNDIAIPYSEFYSSGEFAIVTVDQVLLGQFKDFFKSGQYPFKVATTSPPPIVDAYLLNMSEGSFKTIENGLDINAFELVEVSPNQSFYAVVRGRNTQVYSMDGKLIFEEPGWFSWLDGNNILIQNDRQVKRYELHSTEVRLVDTFATQTNCSQFQNQTPGLMECPVYLNNVSESVNRVFQLTPLKEIQSTQLIESYQEQDRNVKLLARQIEQVPRMIETLSTKEGYSSLTVIDSNGQTKVLMRLNNPSTPEFKFDPKDDQWSGRY